MNVGFDKLKQTEMQVLKMQGKFQAQSRTEAKSIQISAKRSEAKADLAKAKRREYQQQLLE